MLFFFFFLGWGKVGETLYVFGVPSGSPYVGLLPCVVGGPVGQSELGAEYLPTKTRNPHA